MTGPDPVPPAGDSPGDVGVIEDRATIPGAGPTATAIGEAFAYLIEGMKKAMRERDLSGVQLSPKETYARMKGAVDTVIDEQPNTLPTPLSENLEKEFFEAGRELMAELLEEHEVEDGAG